MWLWAAVACGSFDFAEQRGPSAEEQALTTAHNLVEQTATTMQARMIQELGAKGPSDDVLAASGEAGALRWHGIDKLPPQGRVGITSLHLRNPANRPPPWVKIWLDAHEGSEYADVQGFQRIEETPGGKVARVLQPIPMLEQCVRCHGKPEQIPADVRTDLERRYPEDQSKGYAVGDLRGAVWSEVAVGP